MLKPLSDRVLIQAAPAETKTAIIWDTGTGIYINPIDDSWTGTIKVLSNHIIIWWEKNFIWENFEVVWSK